MSFIGGGVNIAIATVYLAIHNVFYCIVMSSIVLNVKQYMYELFHIQTVYGIDRSNFLRMHESSVSRGED